MLSSYRVKSHLVLRITIVCLMFFVLALPMRLPAFAQTPEPDKNLGEGSITFPPAILKDYSIAAAQSVSFAGLDENYLAVGYAPKEFSLQDPKPSFLVIYKETEDGFDKVYRYLPIAPSDYPMPLTFEKMWAVTTWDQGKQVTTALVTSWGETGADYWGTIPIVIAYADDDFRAIPLYEGNLADDKRIKGFTWTSPDFQVDNFFHPTASEVTTILTQGVDVDQGTVTLTFWGDDECKACEHKIVNIDIDLQQ
jgi:hypothetical protein